MFSRTKLSADTAPLSGLVFLWKSCRALCRNDGDNADVFDRDANKQQYWVTEAPRE